MLITTLYLTGKSDIKLSLIFLVDPDPLENGNMIFHFMEITFVNIS